LAAAAAPVENGIAATAKVRAATNRSAGGLESVAEPWYQYLSHGESTVNDTDRSEPHRFLGAVAGPHQTIGDRAGLEEAAPGTDGFLDRMRA
jgi:hypothetical protein